MKGATPCPDTATLSSDFTIQIKPFITRPAHSCQALCRALYVITHTHNVQSLRDVIG